MSTDRPTAYEMGIEIEGYKPTAEEKRFRAIREIGDRFLYIHPVDGTSLVMGTTRDDIIKAIKALLPMGRTARWHNAIDAWTEMIEEQGPDGYVWAILQGSIGAGYAAK